MHMTKVFAFATILVAGAFAAPAADANPPKPPKPQPPKQSDVTQVNACGNGAQPYCCNTDNKGQYTSCYAFQLASQCSQTTVCCNANNSVQICLGNAIIN